MKSFRRYDARIKHDTTLSVYQLVEKDRPGLSIETPSQFVTPKTKDHKLTEIEAYYLAYALKYRDLLFEHRAVPQVSYGGIVFLWFLASDSVARSQVSQFSRPTIKIHGKGTKPVGEALKYYLELDFWVCADFTDYIREKLSALRPYIENGGDAHQFWMVNRRGKEKLKADHPEVWKELVSDGGA